MSHERIPSGIDGLDGLVGGGFPRGSLILLAGNAGTGKTVFAAHFLYNGALKHGENGVYVSFAEGRETFIKNMLGYGLDFEKLEREGKVKVLDLVTVREEAISTILEMILSEIHSLKAGRLVIDSFTAMAQAFRERVDARIVLHTILGKMVRQAGCTTLLIAEVPSGEGRIGLSIEEFVADAVIILKRGMFDGRLIREVELAKLRGTRIAQPLSLFTLDKGFQVFPPFESKPFRGGRFQPVSDHDAYFSTGSEDFDGVMGGGYPKGSLVFMEVGEAVSTLQYGLILTPIIMNFIAQGRGCIAVPSFTIQIREQVMPFVELYGCNQETLENYFRFFVLTLPGRVQGKPFITVEGNVQADSEIMYKTTDELWQKIRQPFMYSLNLDVMDVIYGEQAVQLVGVCAARTKLLNGLLIVFSREGTSPTLKQRAADFSDIHLKIEREHGILLLYGVKPRTGMYVLEMDVSKGYPLPKLTPIV